MPEPLDEDFRAVGYTGAARDHPMNAMALVMLAAWNNVEIDQLSPAMRYHPNPSVKAAWERVAQAAVDHLNPAAVTQAGQPIPRDISRFKRLSPSGRAAIKDNPDPTFACISTAEMVKEPTP